MVLKFGLYLGHTSNMLIVLYFFIVDVLFYM